MNGSIGFICHNRNQVEAVIESIRSRGQIIGKGYINSASFAPYPLAVIRNKDYRTWMGYVYPGVTAQKYVDSGVRLIDLNEHTARGGY